MLFYTLPRHMLFRSLSPFYCYAMLASPQISGLRDALALEQQAHRALQTRHQTLEARAAGPLQRWL
jgi:hypothetical protein